MGIPQIVCLMFTVLTAFGAGITVGKSFEVPLWQVIGYIIAIVLGMIGVLN